MSIFSYIRQSLPLITKPLTLADRILVVLLILVGSSSFILLSYYQTSGVTVQLYVDNHLKYNFDLKQDLSQVITTSNGSIELKIADGKVWIEDSSCPNKICMKIGKISKINQFIVCVPNHVFIQVKGQKEENWIDTFTY